MAVRHERDDDDQDLGQGVEHIDFTDLFDELHSSWKPGQHLSVLGQNGSGKSHLIRWLLELWPDAKVLVIDSTGDFKNFGDAFTTVHEFPRWHQRRWQDWSGHRAWYRLTSPMDRGKARLVVSRALRAAMREGGWVVVIDETRAVAGKPPNLALDEELHNLWQRGRKRDITVIAGAQSPVFLPGAFYDEPRRLLIGFIGDSRRLARVEELGADRDEVLGAMKQLQEFDFVYVERKFRGPVQIVKAPKRLPKPD